MDGFEKIDFSSNVSKPESKIPTVKDHSKAAPITMARSNKKRKKLFITLGIVGFLILFTVFGIIFPAYAALNSAKKTSTQARLAYDALKKQDITLTGQELAKTKESLAETQKSLGRMKYLAYIPFINAYYNDADHLAKAGEYAIESAAIFVESVEPYADVLGLKGQGSFVGGSAETRIETAVKTMDKVTPRIDDIAEKLSLAREEIDNVNPGRYPAFIIGKENRTALEQLRQITDDGVTFVNEARPLIKVLPELLGQPDEKKYLVIFQNDKELRPTGGFLTAYSIFRLDKGIIHVDRSSDIYDLDNTISGKQKAPRPLQEYMPKVPLLNLRDTNLSPDFVVSMKKFNRLYDKSSAPEVDGIIAIDTKALVAVMDILGGEVDAAGMKFTTKNDPRCNCPQVIYELEDYADRPVGSLRENRKGIIGDLMYAIMNKAFSSSPKIYWGPLFQEILNQTAQKHILFYSYDKDGQKGLEALNASGRIKDFEGDYFHLNEANFGGAKSNMFVTEDLVHEYDIKDDGTIVKTVTVNYKNPHPPSDCNLERGNLCLNAVLRDWVRIYVPKGSKLISNKGSEVKMMTYDELDKTVFEGFLTVRPKGTAKLTVTYELPFKLEEKSLPLMIQKQPGIGEFEHVIKNKGKEIEKFKLETDKQLKLSL